MCANYYCDSLFLVSEFEPQMEEIAMGILKAVIASVESTFRDQWRELFYCEALPDTTLIVRGQKYVSRYVENTNGNTIRDGSIICCAVGQCALIIENGKIIEAFETPGEHVFHNEAAPTIFGKSGIKGVMKDIWNRVGFGGDAPPVSQRECGSFLYPFQAEQSDASRVPLGSATGVFLVIRKTNSCV